MSVAIPQFLAGMILPTMTGGNGVAAQTGATAAAGDAFAGLLASTSTATTTNTTNNPFAQLYAQIQQAQTQTSLPTTTLPIEGQVAADAPVVPTTPVVTAETTTPEEITIPTTVIDIMGHDFTPVKDAGPLEAITPPSDENSLILEATGNVVQDKAILFPNVNKGLVLEDGIAAKNSSTTDTVDATGVVAVATIVEPTVITQATQTVETTAATEAITQATEQTRVQAQAYIPVGTPVADATATATTQSTIAATNTTAPQTTTDASTPDALAESLAQTAEGSTDASNTSDGKPRSSAAQGGHLNHLDLAAKVAQHQAATKSIVFSADPNKEKLSDTINDLTTSTTTSNATPALHEIARNTDVSAKHIVLKQDPLHNNVIDQVTFKIGQSFKNGSNKVTVQLNPAELGKVEVKIDVNPDGRTNIVIAVEKPETLQLLQKDSADLQRSLSQAGVQADSGSLNFSLQSGNDNSHYNSNASDRAAANERYKSITEQSEDNSRLVTAYLASNRAGGLDIRV